MQWKIKQFVFCEDKQHLISENDAIQLEPRQAEVLAYFCRNPEKLISRDELVEDVWQGQAVTDNAVNRIIAKLRKSLGDSAKQSDFIVTLPRKGYRFVASVNLIEEAQPQDAQPKTKTASLSNHKLVLSTLVSLLIISLIAALYLDTPKPIGPYQFKSVTALTRDSGEEFLPSVSPNGDYLIYSDYKNQRLDLNLKDLRSGESRLISDQLGNAGNGDWSRDGTQFLYLYTKQDGCELRLATFDPAQAMKLIDKQTVHQCPTGSFGNFALSHDGRKIIYSEIDDKKQSYHIFQKNLDSGKVTQIAQPPIFLAGNREFDLHPTASKLLIASPNEAQQLTFFVSDLDSGKLVEHFSMDGFTCCPVWNDRGDKIIMTGPLPSFSIVEMNLDGSNLETIYSSSHRIFKLKRVPNSSSFVYSGGIYNTDIQFIGFEDGTKESVITSTVADYLPTLSNNEKYLAYISQRSGNSDIWIRDIVDGTDRKLTQFEDNHQYFNLEWSPNDQKIVALTINGIKLIDFISGQVSRLNIQQQQIRGISWVDDNTVAFSLEVNDQWRVFHYDLVSKQLGEAKTSQQYAYYTDASLHSNQRTPLELGQEQFYFKGTKLNLQLESTIDHNRRFYFQLKGNHLFYIDEFFPERAPVSNQKPIYQLIDFNIETQSSTILTTLNKGSQFSVAENGVYFVETVGRNADIFRVDFESQ